MDEQEQQEIIYKLSMFEQQMQHLQHQLKAIEESTIELNSLDFGLDEIKESVGKEILAPMGRGVFVKAKLASDELIIDVGGKNFVNKSIPKTKDIIREQVKKLNEVRKDLEKKSEEVESEFKRMIEEVQK